MTRLYSGDGDLLSMIFMLELTFLGLLSCEWECAASFSHRLSTVRRSHPSCHFGLDRDIWYQAPSPAAHTRISVVLYFRLTILWEQNSKTGRQEWWSGLVYGATSGELWSCAERSAALLNCRGRFISLLLRCGTSPLRWVAYAFGRSPSSSGHHDWPCFVTWCNRLVAGRSYIMGLCWPGEHECPRNNRNI